MLWLRWFVVGLAAGLAVLFVVVQPWGGGAARRVVDFVAIVDDATVRRPAPEVLVVTDVTVGGETRRAIAPTQASRIAWDVTPAAGQWLEVEVALREEAWANRANAVLFRVGLSFDGHYEDLVAQVVDPATGQSDRRWLPLRVDLSPYAGRAVSLIFNTAPAPGVAEGHAHHAAWGAPILVQR